MLVVGGVIGSGIFRKPGVMAGQLGSPEWLMLAWILAGAITLIGALTNAEIAAMIPETGGQYVFFRRIYGNFFAYLYGWAVFSVIQTGSIAAVAYVFAEYSTRFFPLPADPSALSGWVISLPLLGQFAPFKDFWIKVVAGLLIVGLTAVNYLGVKLGALVQNIFTIAKVSAMGLLFLAAFLFSSGGSTAHYTLDSTTVQPTNWLALGAFAAALQGAFWAYDGWNKVPYIAGEIQNPQRNLPRALFWGMSAVTVIYLLMNMAYLYVLPVDEMMKSRLVAADVAERCFSGGGKWIAAAVMLSTFGAANAIILATARVFFSMARHDAFPRSLGIIHPRFSTPARSLVVQGFWSVLLLFSGTFDLLTDMLIFVAWVFYAAGAVGLFILRRREPNTPRPYRVPGYPWLPAIFVLFAICFVVLTFWNDVQAYSMAKAAGKPALIPSLLGLGLVFLGAPFYFLFRKSPRSTNDPTPDNRS